MQTSSFSAMLCLQAVERGRNKRKRAVAEIDDEPDDMEQLKRARKEAGDARKAHEWAEEASSSSHSTRAEPPWFECDNKSCSKWRKVVSATKEQLKDEFNCSKLKGITCSTECDWCRELDCDTSCYETSKDD